MAGMHGGLEHSLGILLATYTIASTSSASGKGRSFTIRVLYHKEVPMKPVVCTAATFVFIATCLAAFPTLSMAGAQQEKVKTCNEEAQKQDLHSDERKKFLSECLSAQGSDPDHKLTAQQGKMKECNKEARDKNLKGDERKKFMSECLKG